MSPMLLDRWFADGEWEAVCRCCGLCCYDKYEESGRIVFTATPCRYLDSDSRCKVYENRLRVCRDCCEVTPEMVLEARLLPLSCGYRQLARRLASSLLGARLAALGEISTLEVPTEGLDVLLAVNRAGDHELSLLPRRKRRALRRGRPKRAIGRA